MLALFLTCPSSPTPTPPRRFMVLARKDPETAGRLHQQMEEHIQLRQERLIGMSKGKDSNGTAPPATQQPPAEEEKK